MSKEELIKVFESLCFDEYEWSLDYDNFKGSSEEKCKIFEKAVNEVLKILKEKENEN